jgi:predicted DCC family thiol-disulfide oxidoreductase YuxK
MGAPDAFSYRDDPSVPPFPDDRPIVIFDGKCVMCSAFARFIMRHDRHRRLRLLAAQSPIGEALYRHFELATENYETNILLADGRAWLKSEASIRIFERLGFPWSLMSVGRVLPVRVRKSSHGIGCDGSARTRFAFCPTHRKPTALSIDRSTHDPDRWWIRYVRGRYRAIVGRRSGPDSVRCRTVAGKSPAVLPVPGSGGSRASASGVRPRCA